VGEPEGSLMFERFTKPSDLSPNKIAVAAALTASAVLVVFISLWKWATPGQIRPDVISGPLWAFFAWQTVESEQDWSADGRRGLAKVADALAVIFGVVFVFGLYAWIWTGGSPWVPAWSFLYLFLPFGVRRRRRVRP
jgi:hypothetical protein